MIEKKVKIGNLYDFYGELLTDKQKDIVELFCLQDFTFGEISEELSVSRQAVFDTMKRVESILENYEKKLGLYAKFTQSKAYVKALLAEVETLRTSDVVQSDPTVAETVESIFQLTQKVLE
ncbi:MAG: YlxM family DNA-binding protein [Clostridia bacterium]|nr:YlxM family DNA-binding protein [Clostridia bacterium]